MHPMEQRALWNTQPDDFGQRDPSAANAWRWWTWASLRYVVRKLADLNGAAADLAVQWRFDQRGMRAPELLRGGQRVVVGHWPRKYRYAVRRACNLWHRECGARSDLASKRKPGRRDASV